MTHHPTGSEFAEQYRLLAEEVEEYAIFMLDLDGHVISWNKGARQIKGYTEEEILGKHFSIFYTEEEAEAGRPEEALAVATREGDWTEEGWRVRKDGSRFWARVTITALVDGELRGFAKVIQDMTEQRRREEELERQRRKAEEAKEWAKQAEEEVRQATRRAERENTLLRLARQVTAMANETDSLEEALAQAIGDVCTHTDWPVGHVYWRHPTDDRPLVSSNLWHVPDTGQFETFRRVTEAANFNVGESLPGLVAAKGGPVWIEDVTEASNFVRSEEAEGLGVKSAFAVPVWTGEETVAVLEFFSDERKAPDEDLMEAVASVGVQVSRVAERETAQRALRQSERRYRRLFTDALEGVAITSSKGAVLDANPAARETLGYEPEEVADLNVADVYADASELKAVYGELQRTGSVREKEVRFRRKNGEEIICEISVTIRRGGEGEPTAYQTFFRDVTERKEAEKALRESEEKFRTLAEGALVGIGLIQDGRYEYLNPALSKITGYAREELIGESPKLFVHPSDWPKVKRQIQRRIEGTTEAVRYETRIQTKSGQVRQVKVSGTRVTYQGRPAAIATIQDVTEEKRLQREVLEVQEEERRRLGQDLHDGVAAQITGATLMLDTLKDEIEAEHPDIACRIEKVQELVKESGEDLRRVSRGLNPLVLESGGVMAALERLVENTDGCKMKCACPSDVLSKFSGKRETHIFWIVQEAITNARRHGEADEIAVRLRKEDGALIIEVEDDGRGFDAADPSTEGIGLRTMKYRAELLGADLRIESSPGEGTLAQCRLPA